MRTIPQWLAERCVIYVGTNRVVVEIISLGLVFKFPIIRLIALYRSVLGFVRGTAFVPFSRWFSYPMESEGFLGFRRLVFKGVMDNWREYWFCLVERHSFAQPTYFSFFGLVNIQLRGEPLVMDQWEFRGQLQKFIEVLYSDAHHFTSINNFCISDGKLRILDYGSRKTQNIIRERGMCVYQNFQVRVN